MPQYEFFCHSCKKTFGKMRMTDQYEAGEILCPYCKSSDIDESWVAYYAITSKENA